MNPEILGIIATLLVLISFLANGEGNIRVINIFGALMFVAYGIMIDALSVWLLNGTLCIIHGLKLKKIRGE